MDVMSDAQQGQSLAQDQEDLRRASQLRSFKTHRPTIQIGTEQEDLIQDYMRTRTGQHSGRGWTVYWGVLGLHFKYRHIREGYLEYFTHYYSKGLQQR